jgi:pyroglutamyl-peptidase
LRAGLDLVQPDILLLFGVSRKAAGFRIERFAYNGMIPRPDAFDMLPLHRRIEGVATTRMATSLPCAALARELRRSGFPAIVSRSAGRYLCNLAYLHALRWSAESAEPRIACFIHVPQPSVGDGGGMTMAAMLAGASRIVAYAAALDRRPAPQTIMEGDACLTGAG